MRLTPRTIEIARTLFATANSYAIDSSPSRRKVPVRENDIDGNQHERVPPNLASIASQPAQALMSDGLFV